MVKEHAVALAKHKTGYRLLLTIFDSVDDTVLVRKAIVSTLQANFRELAKDHWGNMVCMQNIIISSIEKICVFSGQAARTLVPLVLLNTIVLIKVMHTKIPNSSNEKIANLVVTLAVRYIQKELD